MLKRFIIILNVVTFFFMETVLAIPADVANDWKGFLQETQVTQREVSLKELTEKFGSELPEGFRDQLQLFVKEHPDLKVPRMTVQKVMVGKEEQLQMTFAIPNGNIQFTTSSDPQIYLNVVGSVNGENIATNIPYATLTNENLEDAVYQGRRMDFALSHPLNFKALPWGVFEALPVEKQIEYMKQVRAMLLDVEKIQNISHSPFAKKVVSTETQNEDSAARFVLSLLEPKAFAEGPDEGADSGSGLTKGDSCIFAGWKGKWHQGKSSDGYCSYDSGSKNTSPGTQGMGPTYQVPKKNGKAQIRCNPAVYGDGDDGKGVFVEAEPLNPRATDKCEQADPHFKGLTRNIKALAFGSGLKKDEARASFKKALTSIYETVQNVYNDSCSTVAQKNNPNVTNQSQVGACGALTLRVEKAKKLANVDFCDQKTLDGDEVLATAVKQAFNIKDFSDTASEGVKALAGYCADPVSGPAKPKVSAEASNVKGPRAFSEEECGSSRVSDNKICDGDLIGTCPTKEGKPVPKFLVPEGFKGTGNPKEKCVASDESQKIEKSNDIKVSEDPNLKSKRKPVVALENEAATTEVGSNIQSPLRNRAARGTDGVSGGHRSSSSNNSGGFWSGVGSFFSDFFHAAFSPVGLVVAAVAAFALIKVSAAKGSLKQQCQYAGGCGAAVNQGPVPGFTLPASGTTTIPMAPPTGSRASTILTNKKKKTQSNTGQQ